MKQPLAQVNAAFLRDIRKLVWAVDHSFCGYGIKEIREQPILRGLKKACEKVEKWIK